MNKKTSYIFLSIITFGIYPLIVRYKAKKIANTVNNQLTLSSKIDFDINSLINRLGGKDNIIKTSATISTFKVDLKDASNISKETLNKFDIKGFIKNNNQLIIVFGDNANAISSNINKILLN
ncbi:MAG: DUF4234 domain-containing protein [Mycoplasmataceae bacterium]|jgi:phosphotransferase system IIB component|nr:DUF4234 domain-containing protein [Mycoplasmataceae bacterium]